MEYSMKTTIINGVRLITPDDGKVLTNGQVYSDGVYLAARADEHDWTEVDIESVIDTESETYEQEETE